MINKLKELNNKLLNLVHNKIEYIIGPVIVILLGLMVMQYFSYDRPSTTAQYADTAVMVVNASFTSGGTGVILNSSLTGSEVLTNKHVCRLIEDGGYIIKDGHKRRIEAYKKYPYHDLCLLSIRYNFGVNTKVADNKPNKFSVGKISGHPGLMPHVLTEGSFSGRMNIHLITGLKECTEEDWSDELNAAYCFWYGGVPIIEEFDSQLVTGTILPGSSGSGVFNNDGEISGLVFAGNSDGFSYAFIVPYEYVVHFVENKDKINWVNTRSKRPDNLLYRIFSAQKQDTYMNLIWRK